MKARVNYYQTSPQAAQKYIDFNMALAQSEVIKEIKHLVTLRASQLNGCAFCVDMHVKEAKIDGERELRLHHVAIWRESTLFTPRERAALAWTETLTRLPEHGVDDGLYDKARSHFSEAELSDLTFLIVAINGWNRLSVAFQAIPGSADKAFGLDKAGL
ncbi:carboxymuconolactone decarboxylase family protein [Salinicola halophyticus]|uniref:carboxymuconolactone decarboxylase family protein n=1 Tax=Salinicola halophyticus TaxID=1808881 RepID=UPI000DA15CB2|nr:carboxymuconolactone decarboxylase family protein [Salinicola halophyticus]